MKLPVIFSQEFIQDKDFIEANQKLYNMLDIGTNDPEIYDNVLKETFTIDPIIDPVKMTENTLSDMQLDIWCKKQGTTIGGRDLFHQLISAPTTNIDILQKRQRMIKKADISWKKNIERLASFEKDLLWIYTLPETYHDVWPLPLLFPSFPLLRRINTSTKSLDIYHLYRIWLAPLVQIIIPIMSILGPWFYLRFRMKWKLSIKEYFLLIKFLFTQTMVNASKMQYFNRYGTILLYGFMFLYGLIQTIDISRMLHIVRKKMIERIENIHRFINEAHIIISKWDEGITKKPIIPEGMAGIHAIWTDNQLRKDITIFMKRFYELDVSLTCKSLVIKNKWTYANYVPTSLSAMTHICTGLRNPLLDSKQISNPMCLSKNIIITGPNAAGKSTYVRSIGANIICSQTLGICCAKSVKFSPVHAVMSYMRIRDLIGDKSLFETEVAHCSQIIQTATELEKAGKTAVIFFDEPMHSTPALEGEATAYAVLEHLGKLHNIRTIATSHYHRITKLSDIDNKYWVNLCMDAIHDKKTDTYSFPYRIRQGASFQSIALELLRGKNELPASVVQNAIKFKSTINKSEASISSKDES